MSVCHTSKLSIQLDEFVKINCFIPYIFESKSSLLYNDYIGEFIVFSTNKPIKNEDIEYYVREYKDDIRWLQEKGYHHWDEMADKYNFY